MTGHDREISRTTDVFPPRNSSPGDRTGARQKVMPALARFADDPSAEALIRANRQLNLVTGMTRHDVVNKLLVLNGYLELAKEVCSDPGLQILLGELESGIRDIRSDLEFTKIYQDFGTVPPQWQDIREILAGLPLPETLALRTDGDRVLVLADPALKKVFTNLLDNTVRHGRRATRVLVCTEEQPDGLVLAWEDNGIGVPDSSKEKIFTRGFGSNHGLGLYFSRELLTLTGAAIRETGRETAGARFEILFPPGMYRFAGGEPAGMDRSVPAA
jgi:signal transduction histidine kinase